MRANFNGTMRRGRLCISGHPGCAGKSRAHSCYWPRRAGRVLNDLTGALYGGLQIPASASDTLECAGGGRRRLQTQVEEAAERVAGLAGIHEGRREMVRGALLDMVHSLHQVQGGAEAADEFLAVLRGLKEDGLLVDDNALYDDPTPRPPSARSAAIPESVAAARLGPAGRVSVARSLWRRYVPTGLRAVHSKGIRKAGAPRKARLRKASNCAACLSPSTACSA